MASIDDDSDETDENEDAIVMDEEREGPLCIDDEDVEEGGSTKFMSLYIGNLSPRVQYQELERAFIRFGRSKLELKDGYAFVVFEVRRDAERALRALQGKRICGEYPSISWARKHIPFSKFSGRERDFTQPGKISRRRSHTNSDWNDEDDEQEGKSLTGDKTRKGGSKGGDENDMAGSEELKRVGSSELDIGDHKSKERDPLDAGRWGEPLSDESLEHAQPEAARGNSLDQNSEDEGAERNKRRKARGSSFDRSPDPPLRAYRNNMYDQPRRLHDSRRMPQERCFNCGLFGHMMRQCPRVRFDSQRNHFGNIRGNAFRRGVGRFRNIEEPRRFPNRVIEIGYGGRTVRRGNASFGKVYERIDTKSRGRDRRRLYHSDSQTDSSSRERKKKKKVSKRSSKSSRSHLERKHKRSLSSSRSRSNSRMRSSSSSTSSSTSHSSKSRSQSSSSRSRSKRARSDTSISRSVSSRSNSRSLSHTSTSKTASPSQSRSVSHSKSPSPNPQGTKSSNGITNNQQERPPRRTSTGVGYIEDESHSASKSLESNQELHEKAPALKGRSNIAEENASDGNNILDGKLMLSLSYVNPKGAEQHLPPFNKVEGKRVDSKSLGEVKVKSICQGSSTNQQSHVSWGAARLWPWEAVFERRCKRGPITTANYEKRLLQNKDFGIVDRFVRSSSGWWETALED